jgi:hypothetical protein
MEEEGKRIKRETISNKYRIGMFKKLRVEAKKNLGTIERALNAEQEKSRELEDARDDELWAKAFEAGKIPNYKIKA